MKQLAFDTSGSTLTVTLAEDNQVISTFINRGKTHSMEILPSIVSLLKKQKWEIDQIDQVIVAQGPGSFTGLRIGATVAKVLAKAIDAELIGVSSLGIVAAEHSGVSAVYFDARNENVFGGIYDNLENIIADQHINIEKFKKLASENHATLIDGDAFDLSGQGIIRVSTVTKKAVNVDDFVPNYLRETAVELNWDAQHPGVLKDGFVQEI
jgi:tRNA threonylcarbamoyl adenosine modification protein YeaZ